MLRLILGIICMFYALPICLMFGLGGFIGALYKLDFIDMLFCLPFFACGAVWLLFMKDSINLLKKGKQK